DHLARAAQLTQRTNQFNFTTTRRSQADLAEFIRRGGEGVIVEASDRFGEYGVVGLILFNANDNALVIDNFFLRCRALGRGIEHRMLASIGGIASDQQLDWVDIPFVPTGKNEPAREFLMGIGASQVITSTLPRSSRGPLAETGMLIRFPAGVAAAVSYDPHCDLPAGDGTRSIGEPLFQSARSVSPSTYGQVAAEMGDVAKISNIVESHRRRLRPNLVNRYAAPTNEIERLITRVWQDTLAIDRVGIDDNFFEAGGTSLNAVQVSAQLSTALSVEITRVDLFDNPTVRSLARRL